MKKYINFFSKIYNPAILLWLSFIIVTVFSEKSLLFWIVILLVVANSIVNTVIYFKNSQWQKLVRMWIFIVVSLALMYAIVMYYLYIAFDYSI